MGITIYSANKSHDLPYGGFIRLRRTIANLCPCEIRDHYLFMVDHYIELIYHEEELNKYNAKTEELYVKHKQRYGKVIDFLYAPDTDAELTYGTAKQILAVIGDYRDDKIYGYAGWGDRAMRFNDFIAILEDAVQSKKKWGWW